VVRSALFAVLAETMIRQGIIFSGYGSLENLGECLQGFGVLGSDPVQTGADLIGPDRVIATPSSKLVLLIATQSLISQLSGFHLWKVEILC
jgi:hypothetical protein